MGVLDVLSGLATAAGQGYAGYAQDKQTQVKEALAAAAAQQQAARDAVLNRVALAGIDPAVQGTLASVRANAQVQPHIAEAVGSAAGVAPIHIQEAIDTAAGTAPIHTQEAVATAKGLSPITTQTAVNTARATAPIKTAQAIATAKGTADYAAPIAATDPKTGVTTYMTRSDALGKGKAPAGGGAGGGARGLGFGGVFGAGSGIGSVNEMHAANPNLKSFEQGFLSDSPTSDLAAIDRFRQKLAGDLQTHGFITAATSAEAERELAATNPDLAIYGRNLKQWIVSDLNVSKSATDKRGALDMEVSGLSIPLSSMPLAQRKQYISQMWEARDSRLAGLDQGAAAAKAIMDGLTPKGSSGMPTATPSPSKPPTGTSKGNSTLTGGPVTPAERAALKQQGFTDAQIDAITP